MSTPLRLLAVFCAFAACAFADETLFDFKPDFDLKTAQAHGVTVSLAGDNALHVASGHAEDWPGVTLPAPQGHWDLTAYEFLELDVKNVGGDYVTVYCRIDNPGADGSKNCVTGTIGVKPGESKTLHIPFVRQGLLELDLFGMNGYPPQAKVPGSAIDCANVTGLIVFLAKPAQDYVFEISRIHAGGEYTPPKFMPKTAAEFFPFIDTFGQYVHADWPGKTHSVEELAQRRDAEAAELKAQPGPDDWDLYGGLKNGPQLEATGFFYTVKRDFKWKLTDPVTKETLFDREGSKQYGKWWLVDPIGHLFFSNGIDCVDNRSDTPVDERSAWFQDALWERPEFKALLHPAWSVVKNHYKDHHPQCFSFDAANQQRKYGKDWAKTVAELTHARLRSWGLNTIGNWSDQNTYLLRKTPYVGTIGAWGARVIAGSEGYWGQFADVFDPSFKQALDTAMSDQRGKTANDAWCVGYFVDNELAWEGDLALALAALKSPADQPAKRAFIDDLKAKFGEIEKLNAVWGTAHKSWEALLNDRGVPDKEKARAELTAFETRLAETYFKTCRDAVKAVAPHNLYLGCRFAGVNDIAALAAVKYCDVVSYNIYHRSVADFNLPNNADAPVMVGEFHFGALDRGLFHPGLVLARNQDERASMYKEFVSSCLHHPNFVGCHWFQYIDEPTLGRSFDGENYQIGFTDTCDTPYAETIAACREIGNRIYAERAGQK